MRATPTESATAPPGRADAYPHAPDLALIPFSIGSDADDRQMEEWRREVARAAAEGVTRD
jgi:hypothetical protein